MSHDQRLPRAGLWFAISLGLVTILGPAGTDMYLGSLPEMVSELGASTAQGQLTLTVYLLAMGVGQLFFGPIIDSVGRRWPLMIALAAFLLASAWGAVSATITILLVARFLQGLAAAMTLVVAMSMVRDRASGARAAQLFALLMTIEGLAPVLAPTVGGFVDAAWGWRAVLLVLAGLAAVALVNTSVSLPESLPRSARSSLRLGSVIRAYGVIIRDSRFLLPALGLSAVFFFLFVYIGGATFIYQGVYGLDTDAFGLVFGGTGIAVLVGAVFSGRTVQRFGAAKLAVTGAVLILIGAVLAILLSQVGLGLWGIVAGMFVALLGLGISEATLMALAMSSQEVNLGSTAALLGAFQLIISSLATPLAGALVPGGSLLWLAGMAVTGVVALVIVGVSARRARS
ncbi:MAG: multidrug effflux MFS transporter [Leucobacter sp.]|nr:multidrug effflux MFS transporter [Leucobacter sp.]